MSNVTAWDCPDGLVVDGWSRFSGCTISVDIVRFVGWYYLVVWPPLFLLLLYTALRLYRHDPTSSPSRIRGLVAMAVAIAMMQPMTGHPVLNLGVPHSSYLGISLFSGGGSALYCVGIVRLHVGHHLASVFQMIYALEPANAKKWTRKLAKLSVLVGYGMGIGCGICFGGPHFGQDQKSTDTILRIGCVIFSAFCGLMAGSLAYGVAKIRALQLTISADSSTGKALKKLVPLLTLAAAFFVFLSLALFTVAVVPWLLARANTFFLFTVAVAQLFIINGGVVLYELQQLHKRQAAQKRQCQITPTSTNGHTSGERTSIITNMVAATHQALLSNTRQRRDSSASLVLGSGVSLAFLELFVRESGVHATMTANDFVNAHVKPHTKDIGRGGSGAFVELSVTAETAAASGGATRRHTCCRTHGRTRW